MSVTAASPETAMHRVPRWIWVTLVASVSVNLLLIGLMAGAAWFRHRAGGPFATAASPMGFIRMLPKERRDAIRSAAPEAFANMRPHWQAVRQARREADRLLTTEPFSAETFLAAHRRMIEADAAARRAASQILADTAARMTPEERAQMLGWRDRQRWWRRGHGPHGERDDPAKLPEPDRP